MYRHFIWLPVNRHFNFTINNSDAEIKKLGGIDLNSEIYIWVKLLKILLVKSSKVFVPVQQITSVKEKEMLRHGGMKARIQIKLLDQLNISESFLIINSIGKYFSRPLQT